MPDQPKPVAALLISGLPIGGGCGFGLGSRRRSASRYSRHRSLGRGGVLSWSGRRGCTSGKTPIKDWFAPRGDPSHRVVLGAIGRGALVLGLIPVSRGGGCWVAAAGPWPST